MALTSGTASLTSVSSTSIVLAGAVATGGTGPYTYQWLKSTDGSSWSNLAGQTTAASATDSSVTANTGYWYRLQSTDTGAGNAVITSNIVFTAAIDTPARVSSNTSVTASTSTTLVTGNPNRRYVLIQNNSSGNIAISTTGATLTSIIPSANNPCNVLLPNGVGIYEESESNLVPKGNITVYSGATTDAISVTTG